MYPGREVKFTTNIIQTSPGTYKQSGSLQLAPELVWRITSIVKSSKGRYTAMTRVVSREMEPWILKISGETAWPTIAFQVKTFYGGHSIYAAMVRLVNRGQYAKWSTLGEGKDEYERSFEMSLTAPGALWAAESRFAVDSNKAKIGSVLRWSERDSIGMTLEASSLPSIYVAHIQLPSSIWWTLKAAKKDDNIRAELTSSVSGWSKHSLVGKVVIMDEGNTVSTSGKIEGSSLPSAVRFEMSGKRVENSHEIELRVTTPFIGYELNTVKTWWTNEVQEKTLRSTVQWMGETVTFSSIWINREDIISARISSTVPWWAWTKDMLASFEHRRTPTTTSTTVEAGLIQDRRMRIIANTVGINAEKMSADVTVQLPIKDSSVWTIHASNEKSNQNKWTTKLMTRKSGVTLLSFTSEMSKSSGSYYGMSSYRYDHMVSVVVMDNSPIIWTVLYMNKNGVMKYDVNLDYASSSWALTSQLSGLGSQWTSIEGLVILETPLSWFRKHQYTVNFKSKKGLTSPRVNIIADMTPGGKVILTGILDASDASNWKFKGIMITPLKHDVGVYAVSNNGKFAVTFNTKDKSWSTMVKVNAEQGIWYSVGTVSIVTPLGILNSFKTRWSHKIASNQERNVRISMMLSSPAYLINGANVDWRHTSSSWTSVKSQLRVIPSSGSEPISVFASWQLGLEKSEISVDFKAWSRHAKMTSAFRTLDSGLQVKNIWRLDSDTITLKTDIKFLDSTSIIVSLETPWTTMPRLQLMYSGSESSKFTESKWAVKWSDESRVNLVTRYRFTSSRTIFTYNLETPWSVIGRQSSLKFVMTHPWRSANLQTTFSHSSMSSPLEIKLRSEILSKRSVKLVLNVNTPWNMARSITTTLKHNIESDSWTSSVSLELPGYTGELKNIMKISSSTRSYSTDSIARYTYYGREHFISLSSSLDLSSAVKGKLELKSTWEPISLVSMIVRHSNTAPWHLDSSIRLMYGASTSAFVMAKLSGLGDLSASAELVMFGSEMRFLRLRHLTSSPIAFESSAHFSYSPSGKWSLQMAKSGNNGEMTIVTTIKTPVVGWERIIGRINHVTLSEGTSHCTVKVTIPRGLYELTCDISNDAFILSVNSPMLAIQTASVHLTYGTPSKAVLSLNGKTITATGSYSTVNGEIKSSVGIFYLMIF